MLQSLCKNRCFKWIFSSLLVICSLSFFTYPLICCSFPFSVAKLPHFYHCIVFHSCLELSLISLLSFIFCHAYTQCKNEFQQQWKLIEFLFSVSQNNIFNPPSDKDTSNITWVNQCLFDSVLGNKGKSIVFTNSHANEFRYLD